MISPPSSIYTCPNLTCPSRPSWISINFFLSPCYILDTDWLLYTYWIVTSTLREYCYYPHLMEETIGWEVDGPAPYQTANMRWSWDLNPRMGPQSLMLQSLLWLPPECSPALGLSVTLTLTSPNTLLLFALILKLCPSSLSPTRLE